MAVPSSESRRGKGWPAGVPGESPAGASSPGEVRSSGTGRGAVSFRQSAWRVLLLAHARAVGAIAADLAAAGAPLTMEDYDLLLALHESGGDRRLRLSDLADRLLLTRSGITRVVDRLEARGYLARRPCEEDRRGSYAELTLAGVEALRATWAYYEPAIERHFGARLDDTEADALRRTLGKVAGFDTPVPVELRVSRPGDVAR